MIVVDVEASGTNYEKHSVVSVGAIDFDNPSRHFYGECRVWDGAHIDEDALKVNGFTEDQLKDTSKKTEAALVAEFLEWIKDARDRTLAGQNPSFDRDMLRAAAHRAHMDWPLAHRTLDTHSMCWMHMVKRGFEPPIDHQRSMLNLDAVLNYVGIPNEPEPHNALTGAKSHAEVISRLLHDKKLLPEFEQYEIAWLS